MELLHTIDLTYRKISPRSIYLPFPDIGLSISDETETFLVQDAASIAQNSINNSTIYFSDCRPVDKKQIMKVHRIGKVMFH